MSIVVAPPAERLTDSWSASRDERCEPGKDDRLLVLVYARKVAGENAADARVGVRIERLVGEMDMAARRIVQKRPEPEELGRRTELRDPDGGDVLVHEVAPILVPDRRELFEVVGVGREPGL